MLTVALIGPDGAGKTTIARELERALPLRVKYLYMGVNWEASDHLLPTTRLIQAIRRARKTSPRMGGPPEASTPDGLAEALPKRAARSAWAVLALANRIAEESYRLFLAWFHRRRGTLVVFDRDFFADYHAHDVAGRGERSLDRRLHGYLLSRIYPKPDLVIYLDAPAELLLARKGEGTLESLERRRHHYLALASEKWNFVIVDAGRALHEVVADVMERIEAVVRGAGPTSAATGSTADERA